ncbi:MAG: hypothetical protein J6Y02_12595 [Pseudobutyrivibrio sp.]|nr:hypothetical protein [Pseudobutyrivibrio sp.]
MFKISVAEKETLEEKTRKIFGDCEKLLFEAMKASGLDISDIADADDDTVILFKRYMELMKSAEELAIAQAEQLDKIDMLDTILKNVSIMSADVKMMDKKLDVLMKKDTKK